MNNIKLARLLSIGILAVLLAAMLGHQLLHTGFIIDDAFISFRYADNFARGEGLVFNPGERVEGYSNPLWTVATGIAIKMGADPIWFTRVVSYGCGLGIVFLLWRMGKRLGHEQSDGWNLLAPAAAVLWHPFSMWANSGLETILFTFLLLAGVERFLAADNRLSGRFIAGVVFGVAGITRPEGPGYLLLLASVAFLWDLRRNPGWKHALGLLIASLAGMLLILTPLLLWRWQYYGELLPNSIVAKGAALALLGERPVYWLPALLVMREGTPYIWGWLLSLGVLPALLALLGLLRKQALESRLYLAAAVFGGMVVTWWNFGDWMPGWRLLVPVTPLLLLLAQESVRDIAGATWEKLGSQWVSGKYIPALIGLVVSVSSYYFITDGRHGLTRWVEEGEPLGKALGKVGAPGDTLATGMAGSIPYFSRLHTIDTLGLCDKHIAHNGSPIRRWGKEDWDYVLDKQPSFWHVTTREAKLLSGRPEFSRNYLSVQFLSDSPLDKCQYLYVRRGSLGIERMQKAFAVQFIEPEEALERLCDRKR